MRSATALVLIGTLGLAWLQVRERHALGPEQAIPGTPLRVRPPQGWTQDPQDPSSFILPVERAFGNRARLVADRRITFGYEPDTAFQSAAALGRSLARDTDAEPEQAKIGPYPAVQVSQILRQRFRGRIVIIGESLLRAAVLPGGEVITVKYVPLTELTPADLDLLNRICANVRVVDERLSATVDGVRQRAGVDLELPDEAVLTLPELTEVPGFYLSGNHEGLPAWALGVFRTWLAAGRTAQDLLTDIAAEVWHLPDDSIDITGDTRSDGAPFWSVHAPEHAPLPAITDAYIVAGNDRQAALLLLFVDVELRGVGRQAAVEIIDSLELRTIDAVPPVDALEEAGTALAALLARRGALPWWGRRPQRLVFAGETPLGRERLIDEREVRAGGRGYAGRLTRLRLAQRYEEHTAWRLGERGRTYRFETERYLADPLHVEISEWRRQADGPVQREIRYNELRNARRSFRPGAAFVCPPMESIAEARVAWGDTPDPPPAAAGSAIIEVSGHFGPATYTRLLRPLTPDGELRRVLVQDDFWPLGVVVAYDAEGEIVYQHGLRSRYERIESDS